ncbi:MAG: ABC transporter ATP-binding protein/permease [Lachnospiraceae bacterium]|nr:ABC transporter ATP-binding protein/permease [Lachnospiraceae bacterium]
MKKQTLFEELRSQFFVKNKGRLAVAALASVLGGTIGLMASWVLKTLTDTISGAEGALSLVQNLQVVGVFFVMAIVTFVMELYSQPAFIRKGMSQYKNFAFQKLTEKHITSFRDESTAAYLSALTNDAGSIEANYLSQLTKIFNLTVMFFGSIGMMVWYSPILTAVAVGVTILPLMASILTGSRLSAAEKRVSDRNKTFTATLADCLGGFAVVKSFKAEREMLRLFAEKNRELEGEKYKRRKIQTVVGMIGTLTGMLAQFGVFIAGAYLAIKGRSITAGTVVMFVNLMNFMIQPVSELPGLLAGRKAALGLVKKLAEDLTDNTEAEGTETVTGLKQGIELSDVSFSHDEKEILHNVSLSLEAGRAYAIVGASGSGKSTLLNLLMAPGLAYNGKVLYDGVDIRDIRSESLYELISVIQQNVFVFSASIRDNVTMFRDFPKEEMDEAIRLAHLDTLLSERGEGYLCGENGCNLSGGEKQRISIARSLLKKSSVLLADEATAALDRETAWQVSSDILDLEGITRVVVTHSLEESLLKRYDGILVLRDGRIAETGTFEELMAARGYFYALYTVAQ